MVYRYDPSYSLLECDICRKHVGAEEKRDAIRAEFECSNSYPDSPSSVGQKYVGHYCPDCHDFEELDPSTIETVRYHYSEGELLMVEIERSEARVRWKVRPDEAPEQIVELGEQIGDDLAMPGR